MAQLGKKTKLCLAVIRYSMIFLFNAGFIYQTLQFLFLYWTYPTVVDIQQSSPSYVELPAFTICNRIGYHYKNICKGFKEAGKPCISSLFSSIGAPVICAAAPGICTNGSLPKGFQIVFYRKFLEKYAIKREDLPKLGIPLESYLNCTIEFAGEIIPCNMENTLGTVYTLEDMPQFCYSMYSLWGQPDKKRELIPKGATMKFILSMDVVLGKDPLPLYNPPCDASAQIAVHSPYFLPSPYLSGSSFLGGRAYELRIKLSERHLLPLPYQTNCTDYMTLWKERNGTAPINQLNIIQECRINKTYEALGCIPIKMDYPHKYDLCRLCAKHENDCNFEEPPNNCSLLADSYNQPCDSLTYLVDKENKAIIIEQQVNSTLLEDGDKLRMVVPMHDCEGKKAWGKDCLTTTIYVPFDQFEITNITYNPKFESLELFSVIGGYMGMWLGISLLTIYDIFFDAILYIKSFMDRRRKKKVKALKKKNSNQRRNPAYSREDPFHTSYAAW